jgi:phosphoglycolate phosphatase
MARAAGATALGVTWGYHEASALEQAGAYAVIGRFEALGPMLERIWTN